MDATTDTQGGGGADRLARLSGLGLFAVAVWGASFVATRVALTTVRPFGLVAIRLLLGAAVLLAVVVWRRGSLPGPRRALVEDPRDLWSAAGLALILSLHLLLQAYGLEHTSAINAGWIISFTPVALAVTAQALGRQRLRGRGWLGVALGAVGVSAVTLRTPPDLGHARWGDLLQVLSCFTWTAYTLASGPLVARHGALRTTALTMSIAAVFTGIVAAATGWCQPSDFAAPGPPVTSLEVLGALLFLGPVCSGLAYYAWFAAVDRDGPTRVGALLYLEPFVTVAVAWTWRNEPVYIHALLGGVLVLLGVRLVARGARPSGAVPRPAEPV